MLLNIMTSEDKKHEVQKNETKRDEELDISKAVEKSQDIMRKIIGNLQQHQFRLESVQQNGDKTKYIIICSIVPDLGKDRDYYFIKVDVETGELVPPMGRGKIDTEGKMVFQQIEIKSEWTE